MIVCHCFRHLAICVFFFPIVSAAQPHYLNDVNIHAYRHFHKHWPGVAGEVWSKSGDGLTVSFTESAIRTRVFFDLKGSFQFAMKSYAAAYLSPELAGMVKKKYPDYSINVVTELTDGNKTFYRVTIENKTSVKTLSVIDEKLEVCEDLVNGGLVRN